MFTGIIEETGNVLKVYKGAKNFQLTIRGKTIFNDLKIGDSVAVNGVCLTVKSISGLTFIADVMPQTIANTMFSGLKAGSLINLERAMQANGRFGGHIMSGHIDGTGTIIKIQNDGNAVLFTVRADKKIMKYIIEKGSVGLDGISLTVAHASKDYFVVSIIPHTVAVTSLHKKSVGDKVNIENDIVGKYIGKLMGKDNDTGFSNIIAQEMPADFASREIMYV